MSSVRVQGAKTFFVGAILAALIGTLAYVLKLHNYAILGVGWGIPGAVALIGLVQVVSGVPFAELSAKWDSLHGWQRGVLGTLIFAVACAIIFGIFIAVAITFFS